ncbi:bleomycin resistance protein [Variovorax sp. KBW07]|uniref:VOC family protein n=1 Tax=Variovorax sp. KBW07 TaxID=2153358 RepID=UPI000F5864F9|nr:VOC family protein [Variovorax sp. KBW07]RQO44294.1 bleomycin resistance protein [Variovorax sp. KBW07]
MTTPALNLLVLRVASMEASAGFYTALGLRFVQERHGQGPEHLSVMTGGVLLEIYPAGDGPTTHPVRLGFRVSSIDSVIDAVLRAGGTLLTKPAPSPWGTRAVLVDPDGHKVELLEAS